MSFNSYIDFHSHHYIKIMEELLNPLSPANSLIPLPVILIPLCSFMFPVGKIFNLLEGLAVLFLVVGVC
jgi:hypothetical protein